MRTQSGLLLYLYTLPAIVLEDCTRQTRTAGATLPQPHHFPPTVAAGQVIVHNSLLFPIRTFDAVSISL